MAPQPTPSYRRKPMARGTVVLWRGRGLYAVVREHDGFGGIIRVDLAPLEKGLEPGQDVPAWFVDPVPAPRASDLELAQKRVRSFRRKRTP